MSNQKFGFLTVIVEGDSFFECGSLEEFEGEYEEILGYFSSSSNTTYEELDYVGNNEDWLAVYVEKGTGDHLLEAFRSTVDLRLNLKRLAEASFGKDSVHIFNYKEFVPMRSE